jgi:hypothetical protein
VEGLESNHVGLTARRSPRLIETVYIHNDHTKNFAPLVTQFSYLSSGRLNVIAVV